MNFYFLFVLVAIIICFNIRSSFSSNYEIILERIETALGDDDKISKFHTLRIKKFNHTTYVVNGKYTLLRPLEDSMVISGAGLNLQGGQYKKMFDKVVETPLTRLYNESKFEEYFVNYQKHQKVQIPWKTNPFPAGDNEVINCAVEDYGSLLPAYLPGGEDWKFEVRVFENDELLGGMNVFAKLRNQRTLLAGK